MANAKARALKVKHHGKGIGFTKTHNYWQGHNARGEKSEKGNAMVHFKGFDKAKNAGRRKKINPDDIPY